MSYTENTPASEANNLDILLDFIPDTPVSELESGFQVIPEGKYEVRLVNVGLAATKKGQSAMINFVWEVRYIKNWNVPMEEEQVAALAGRKFQTSLNSDPKIVGRGKDMFMEMARMWFGATNEEAAVITTRAIVKLLMTPDENEVRIADVEVKHRKVKSLNGGDDMTFTELKGAVSCHIVDGATLSDFAGTAHPASLS